MKDWEFKALQVSSSGKSKLGPLSVEQAEKTDDYTRVLSTAVESKVSNPKFSKYYVKEAIGISGSDFFPAGNIEYGYCQALHGEECSIAVLQSIYRKDFKDKIILGIVAGKPGNIPAPCGNCRDIMLDELGTNFEIVSGAPEGGIAVVSKISDYLFEDFHTITIGQLTQESKSLISDFFDESTVRENILDIAKSGEFLVHDAYSSNNIHPERKYIGVVYGRYRPYVGAYDVMCDYHPIYALRDAVRLARRNNDPFIRCALIACKDFRVGMPHVMYKDRQHLLELNIEAELLLEQEQDPPVYLIIYKDNEITGIWKTSIKQWLPFPFSPYAFGPEFIESFTQYLKKKQAQF